MTLPITQRADYQIDPMRFPVPGERRLWAWIFLAWTAVAVLFASQTAIVLRDLHTPFSWPNLYIGRLLDWYSLAMFTPVLIWLARRFPADRAPRMRNGIVLLSASVAIVALKYTIIVPVTRAWLPNAYTWTIGSAIRRNMIGETLCTLAVLGIIHAILFYDRVRIGEAALANARLEALTAQLQPHFLFNAMNGIVTLIRHDASAAEHMLVGLGELLRRSLDERTIVPLRDEMAVAELYAEIMRSRLSQHVTIQTDVPPDVADVPVPRFLLQPLIENAFKHGVARRTTPGIIAVTARRADLKLVISVADNGPGFVDAAAGADGLGLRNTLRRLRAVYGDSARLEFGHAALGGALVTLELPAS
jgi:LytS/YehU family sensor histidine kinase